MSGDRLTVKTNVALSLPERILGRTHVGPEILWHEILEGELHVGGVAVTYFLRVLVGRIDQQLVVEAPEVDSVGEGVHLTLQGDGSVDGCTHQLVGHSNHGVDCGTGEQKIRKQSMYIWLSVCLSLFEQQQKRQHGKVSSPVIQPAGDHGAAGLKWELKTLIWRVITLLIGHRDFFRVIL